MMIKYSLLDPSGNITILVESKVEKEDREFVSKVLMLEEPKAEQLGFITVEKDKAILEMAGGEFCGNAVRCASVLTGKSVVSCIGRDIKCDGESAYIPKDIGGIKHEIFLEMIDSPEEEIRKRKDDSATGFMFFDEKNLFLKPLVYVRDIDTLFWENSCASGTSALATYLANRDKKDISLDIKEPGGILKVETSVDSPYVKLSGKIEKIKEREFILDEI